MESLLIKLWYSYPRERIGLFIILFLIFCYIQIDFLMTGNWYKRFRLNTFKEFRKKTKNDINDLKDKADIILEALFKLNI